MQLTFWKITRFLVLAIFCLALQAPLNSVYAAAAAKKEGATEKTPEELELMSKYVRLDPIIIPVIQENGLQQVISMVVVIEATSAGEVDKIKEMKPKLADAFLSDMYGTFSRPANMNSGLVKISELKTRLVELATKILGDGVVSDVLLQVLQQRPA